MILCFLVNTWISIDRNNWSNLSNQYQNTPVLIMCHTPWCSHCKKSLPIFRSLGEKFENNSKIVMGAIGCDLEKELCNKLSVSQYPSFVILYNGETKHVHSFFSEKSLDDYIKRIISIENGDFFDGSSCNTSTFPFVFYQTKFDNSIPQNIIKNIMLFYPSIGKKSFCIQKNQSLNDNEINIIVSLGKGVNVGLYGTNDYPSASYFLIQNSHAYFGEFSLSSIMNQDRPIVLLFTSKRNQINDFRNIALDYINDFVFVDSKYLSQYQIDTYFSLNKKDYPSALVLLPKASKFAILKNISSFHHLDSFLSMIKVGSISFSPYIRNPKNEMRKAAIHNFVKLFGIVFGSMCGIIAVFGFLYYLKKKNDKLD